MRGIANDPNQNGGYPEFLVNVVGANGSVRLDGPAPLDQPRIYFGPVISNTSADYAIVGSNGNDREYDYETNTETKNYTYTGPAEFRSAAGCPAACSPPNSPSETSCSPT